MRSARSGQRCAKVVNSKSAYQTCSYISSVITITCGWRRITSPSASSSSPEKAAPDGFDGELNITQRVFAVSAASSCVGVSRSDEHTYELQALMRIHLADYCLKQ